MLHARYYNSDSRNFLTSKTYRDKNFHTLPQDRPLFAQFCGNNPDTIVRAARIIESEIDAVDINFGCPQVPTLNYIKNEQLHLFVDLTLRLTNIHTGDSKARQLWCLSTR